MTGQDEGGAVLDTLSVLFTDIVGSTALRAQLGEDVAEVVRRSHDALIAEIVEGHGGRVIKGMGDGFLATFGSAARAVTAAVGIQQGIDAQRFVEPHVALLLRIGISLGDVTVEAGDVFGTPVIEAARLCAAAEGGQILATSVVEALARSRGNHTFTPVGDLELKGLPDPVPTVEIGWERAAAERGVPFPHPLSVREGAFPFRGREAPLAALTTPWKQTLHAATKGCVLIAGEPGMGKTRLASEFAQRAHGDGALVLFGRCDEELGISYQPFVEALAHHAAHLDSEELASLGAHATELTRLVPEIATRFPDLDERTASGDAEVDQYRLFEAVDSWLAAAAGSDGLVLVLDDIHWAAKPTLLMLRHVLRSATQSRVLIVATYRDTDLDRTHPLSDLLADLRRVPEVKRLPLGGLDRAGIEDLMEAVNQAELDAGSRELAAAVHDETEGNPFFVGELFRHLAETGALVNDGTVWRLTTRVSDLSIPDGIREVIGRRLSRLSESANGVLSWAAVIGRELRLDVLAAVAGDQDDCLDAVDEAVDARLVDEVGAGRWRFSHALVRATLLAELRTTRKVRMHLSVGEAYERLAPRELAALAQHFSEAAPLGGGEKAVGYLLAAGDVAIETLAFDEAVDLYQRALDIIDDVDLDVPELQADAAIGLAIATRWVGREYHECVERACDRAVALGDGARMAKVLLDTSRGYVTRVFEVDEPLVARLEQCLVLLPAADSRERVLVTMALANELSYANDLDRLVALHEDAIRIARRLGDREMLALALQSSLNDAQYPDRLSVLVALGEEAWSLRTDVTTPQRRATMGFALGAVASWTGDREMFRLGLEDFAALADSTPVGLRSSGIASRGGFELRYGSLEDAAVRADELLQRVTETGEPDAMIWYVNLMGATRRQQGRHDEAIALYSPLIGDRDTDAVTIACAGLVALSLCEAERQDEARPVAARCFPAVREIPRDTSFLPILGPIAIAAAELGEVEPAAWLLEQLEPFAGYWSAWGANAPVAPIPTLVGRLKATLGDFMGAEDAFAQAVDHTRANGAPFFLADALLYQGLARRDAGAVGDAVTVPVREALDLATAGGYGTIERRAERALAG